MALLVYLNGKFVDKDKAKVSVWDHGLLYGDGVFEGIRAYGGRVFRLNEHLRRLYESAKSISLKIPLSIEEMEEAILETLRKNNLRDAYIRVVVTRGVGDLGIDPRSCAQPTIIIITDRIQLYPSQDYEQGLKIIIAATRKNLCEAINPRIKSLNYLNNILAKLEAIQAGTPEAVMINIHGYVTECTADNIFIYKKDSLITPPAYVGILEGVTRNVVIEIARRLNIQVREEIFGTHDLLTADECFLTGTGAEIIPVIEINGRPIGSGKPGKITRLLLEEYHKLTEVEGTFIFKEDSEKEDEEETFQKISS